MKSSGEKTVFKTGAVRDIANKKPRMELLPYDLFDRLAVLYGDGAEEYGDNNWRLGQKSSHVFASLERHARAYYMGLTDEDHLAAIIWNALALMNNETYYKDDEYICDLQTWFTDGKPNGRGSSK
jgi:hypothetical protein